MTDELIVWHYTTGLVWAHTTLKNKKDKWWKKGKKKNAHRMLLLGRAKHQMGEMTKCLPFYNVKAHFTTICCSQLDLIVNQIQVPLESIHRCSIDHLTSHFWCIKVTWKTRESTFIDNIARQIASKEKCSAWKPNLVWHPVSSSIVSLAFWEYLH